MVAVLDPDGNWVEQPEPTGHQPPAASQWNHQDPKGEDQWQAGVSLLRQNIDGSQPIRPTEHKQAPSAGAKEKKTIGIERDDSELEDRLRVSQIATRKTGIGSTDPSVVV